MSDLLSEAVILFFEAYCCKMFCEIFGKARCRGFRNAVQLFLLAGCVWGAARGLAGFFVGKQAVMVFLFGIFMFRHANISFRKSLTLAVLYQAMLLSIDYLTYSINIELRLNHGTIGRQYRLGNILVILLGKLVLFLIIFIFRKRLGEKSTKLFSDAAWFKILIFPVFTIILIAAMLSLFKYAQTFEQAMLLTVSAFGMVGMNIMVFYLINDILEREIEIYENRISHIQSENRMKMYRLVSENFDRQRKKTHEYKNQMICIQSLLEKRQYGELKSYIDRIYGKASKEPDVVDTNHVIVNAIINAKYQEADADGTAFVFRVNDLSGLWMEDEDIVTVLSNLLDNAIEACKKCDRGRRILKLKFVMEDGMIKIGVRNTFQNPVHYENGELRTTKMSEAEEHGVGIKNITGIVEKYGGSCIIKACGQEFCFSIVIPGG